MKKMLQDALQFAIVGGFIGLLAAFAKEPTPTVFRFAILVLLLVVVILLWRLSALLRGLADKLGFNPRRTERINALSKKLYDSTWFSTSKLTEAQKKELDDELAELLDADDRFEPAKTAQMYVIIWHLERLSGLRYSEREP